MPRDYKVYLEDIIGAIERVERYTFAMSFEAFVGDEKTIDAVVRNLEQVLFCRSVSESRFACLQS